MDLKKMVREYIVREFMYQHEKRVLTDDALLIEDGIVDSMGLVKLILFIEEKAGVRIEEEELELENFRTLDAIVNFIAKKIS